MSIRISKQSNLVLQVSLTRNLLPLCTGKFGIHCPPPTNINVQGALCAMPKEEKITGVSDEMALWVEKIDCRTIMSIEAMYMIQSQK